jgi:hypothetical protein
VFCLSGTRPGRGHCKEVGGPDKSSTKVACLHPVVCTRSGSGFFSQPEVESCRRKMCVQLMTGVMEGVVTRRARFGNSDRMLSSGAFH